MKEQSMNKFHIKHLMLCEFRKHNNAANATNAINPIYPNALDSNTIKTMISIFSYKIWKICFVFTSKSPSFYKKKKEIENSEIEIENIVNNDKDHYNRLKY